MKPNEIPTIVLQDQVAVLLSALVEQLGGNVHLTPDIMHRAKGVPVFASVHPEGGIQLVTAMGDDQRPSAYSVGIVTKEDDDFDSAEKGDLYILMHDSPVNRRVQCNLIRS